MEDHGCPEAVGDEVPGEDGLEVAFIQAVFAAFDSLAEEEDDPGDYGGEEDAQDNGGAPRVLRTAFFESSDEENGGGEEENEACEVDTADGVDGEFRFGVLVGEVTGHADKDEDEGEDSSGYTAYNHEY